jgi:hypothetical protein
MSQTLTRTDKKPYTPPTVTVLGDIEAITLGFDVGGHLDADFPQGTDFNDITLS